MSVPEVPAAAVLRHRVEAHGLSEGSRNGVDVLGAGVRDNPAGVTAPLALLARDAEIPDAEVVRAYSIRSAVHAHRVDDIGLLRAALRWRHREDPSEQTYGPVAATLEDAGTTLPEALDLVVAAMRDVMSAAHGPTKGELSTAVTPLVPPAVAPWCASCDAHHVNDGLFRHATLLAGLLVVADPGRSLRLHMVDAAVADGHPEQSGAELLRRYVHLAGVATPAQLATWTGLSRPCVRRWWDQATRELTAVRVNGTRSWALTDDLDTFADTQAMDPSVIRLLPAYDPYTEVADRKLLVPDTARRRQVWRALHNPGVIVRDGEIVGVWRDRKSGGGRTVTIEPFDSLAPEEQASATADAERLFHTTPVDVGFAEC